MAISDASPERRNLILASLAFIIFYAANGQFSGYTIKLLVVNVSFSRSYILAYSAWVLLFWFCLRFWQKVGFDFWSSITTEIVSGVIPKPIITFIEEKAKVKSYENKRIDSTKDIEISMHNFKYFFVRIVCNFKNNNYTIVHQETITLNGFKGIFFTIKAIIFHSFNGNAFSECLMPYLLFLIAISSPFWSNVLWPQT